MRKLTKGGIPAYKADGFSDIAVKLEAVAARFVECGVFVVPVGTLEYWLSDEFMKDSPSKLRKQEYANEAANRIRKDPTKAGEITAFLKGVVKFLAKSELEDLPKNGSST
jgi:hypothetical protein